MTSIERNSELSDANFTKLCAIIHKNTGITIADGRKSMLFSRLRGHLRETKEPNFESYISRVSSNSDEMQELINRVTTNKTYFYRTPRVWQHFRNTALAEFLEKSPKRPMRIWSGAASTGEEAHTIGAVLEHTRQSVIGFDYSILGTDVSSRVLQVAENGLYSENAVNPFRKEAPEIFDAHMKCNKDGDYYVSPEIKSRIKFKLHNLLKSLKGTKSFDVVFLRNVLIYFTPEDQEAILRNVHAMLPPNGILYIGESESITRLTTGFTIEDPMVYRAQSGSAV